MDSVNSPMDLDSPVTTITTSVNNNISQSATTHQPSWQDLNSPHFFFKPITYHNVIHQSVLSNNLLRVSDNQNNNIDSTTTTTTTTSTENDFLVFAKETLLELSRVQTDSGVVSTVFQQPMFGKIKDLKRLPPNNSQNGENDLLVLLGDHLQLLIIELNMDRQCFETKYEFKVPCNTSRRNMRSYTPHQLAVDQVNSRAIAVACVQRNVYVYPVATTGDQRDYLDQPIQIQLTGIIWHIEFLRTDLGNRDLYLSVIANDTRQNIIHIFKIDPLHRNTLLVSTINLAENHSIHKIQESVTQYILRIPAFPDLALAIHGSEFVLIKCFENNKAITPVTVAHESFKQSDVIGEQCCLVSSFTWTREDMSNTLVFSVETGAVYVCQVGSDSLQFTQIDHIQSHTSFNILHSLQHNENGKLLFCSGEMSNSEIYEIFDRSKDQQMHLEAQKLSEKANLCPAIDFEVFYDNHYLLSENNHKEEQEDEKTETSESADERKTLVCTAVNSKNNSLRVVRRGVGIQAVSLSDEQFNGINGIWTLKKSTDSLSHLFVVMGFLSATRVLMRTEDGLEDISDVSSFEINNKTLQCACIGPLQYVQVTHNGVRVIQFDLNSDDNLKSNITCEWTSYSGAISVACICDGLILLGLSQNNRIILLDVDSKTGALKVLADKVLNVSAASFTIIPSHQSCLVGTYNQTIELLKLDSLDHVHSINLAEYVNDGLAIVESMFLQNISNSKNTSIMSEILFVGLRDGTLLVFSVFKQGEEHKFSLKRLFTRRIGMLPVSLIPSDYNKLLAVSNDTFIVEYDHIRNQFDTKITSMERVLFLSAFNTHETIEEESFIAVAEDYKIDLYILDYSQPLNVKAVHTDESCRRVLIPEHGCRDYAFALSDDLKGEHSLQIIDLVTNETTIVKQFGHERPFSICEWLYSSDDSEKKEHLRKHFILVGTQMLTSNPSQATLFTQGSETNNPRGSLHLFELVSKQSTDGGRMMIQCDKVFSMAMPGIVYAIEPLSSQYIIASSGNRIVLITLNELDMTLEPLSQNMVRHFVQSLSCCPGSDLVIASDRYDALSVFKFNREAKTLQFIENERISRSSATALMMDEDLFVGVDREGGFFALQYQESNKTNSAPTLHNAAYLNMRDTGLKLRPLHRRHPEVLRTEEENDSTGRQRNRHVTCVTVCGSIINFMEITYVEYFLLSRLERLLWAEITRSDRLKQNRRAHLMSPTITVDQYRSKTASSEHQQQHLRRRVIDGEFVCAVWDSLDHSSRQQIISQINSTVQAQSEAFVTASEEELNWLLSKLSSN